MNQTSVLQFMFPIGYPLQGEPIFEDLGEFFWKTSMKEAPQDVCPRVDISQSLDR